jgi:hypothetical protein
MDRHLFAPALTTEGANTGITMLELHQALVDYDAFTQDLPHDVGGGCSRVQEVRFYCGSSNELFAIWRSSEEGRPYCVALQREITGWK